MFTDSIVAVRCITKEEKESLGHDFLEMCYNEHFLLVLHRTSPCLKESSEKRAQLANSLQRRSNQLGTNGLVAKRAQGSSSELRH